MNPHAAQRTSPMSLLCSLWHNRSLITALGRGN
jgi:hypothetical protein